MTVTENTRAVAARFTEAVEQGDRAALDRLMAADAEWWVLGRGQLDRSGFMQVRPPGSASPIAARRKILGLTIEGDRAAIEIEVEVVWPQGTYRNRCHHLIVVRGDQIIQFREYLDPSASKGFFPDRLPAAQGAAFG